MSHILVIDIGNTSTSFGYFKNGRLKKTCRLKVSGRPRGAPLRLQKLKKNFPIGEIETAVIASVVPDATRDLKKAIFKQLGLKSLEAGIDFPIPIKNCYKKPKQVGIDRLINAAAGFHQFKKDLIIIDFGTAITFDVVTKNGAYLGGVIAPGIEISLEALYRKTALLPKIRLTHSKNIIGKNTVESIRIGCSFGIAGLCERIVHEIKKDLQIKPLVIATGGYANFVSKYLRIIDRVEPHLILNGLLLSYQSYLKKTLDK